MAFDHDDLGIDLERTKGLPECCACRKKSDGAVRCSDGTYLCGAHYDEFVQWRLKHSGTAYRFAIALQETTYKACWSAREDD